jgi:hypothetical protein
MTRLTVDPCPDAPRPFRGTWVVLDRPRRCAVCGRPMPVDDTVIATSGYVAHVGGGQWDGFPKWRGSP